MNRLLIANILVCVSLILSLTAIVALATDAPAIRWARGLIPVAIIFSILGSVLRHKARKGE